MNKPYIIKPLTVKVLLIMNIIPLSTREIASKIEVSYCSLWNRLREIESQELIKTNYRRGKRKTFLLTEKGWDVKHHLMKLKLLFKSNKSK